LHLVVSEHVQPEDTRFCRRRKHGVLTDPEQRFLYVASRSPARVCILDCKTFQRLGSFGGPGGATRKVLDTMTLPVLMSR
jgi:hypothetical protein